LKDTTKLERYTRSNDFVVVSAERWQRVSVPLSVFAGVNLGTVENINIAFNRDHGSGSICIDDIAFIAELVPSSSTVLTFSSGPGTPAEMGRQMVVLRAPEPGQYRLVLENANPPWSEHWLRWDYLALKQGDTIIWAIGEDEAPPAYSFEAASELCDPRRSKDCTSTFVAGETRAAAFFFDLNDSDRTKSSVSFTLSDQQTDVDLELVLSTIDSTHPGAAHFKMKVTLEQLAQR
jgi:hypothetical protein